jgi:hypothetical protein
VNLEGRTNSIACLAKITSIKSGDYRIHQKLQKSKATAWCAALVSRDDVGACLLVQKSAFRFTNASLLLRKTLAFSASALQREPIANHALIAQKSKESK